MLICGQVSSKEEAKEIENMAKLFIVGCRSRKLSEQSKSQNKKLKVKINENLC